MNQTTNTPDRISSCVYGVKGWGSYYPLLFLIFFPSSSIVSICFPLVTWILLGRSFLNPSFLLPSLKLRDKAHHSHGRHQGLPS